MIEINKTDKELLIKALAQYKTNEITKIKYAMVSKRKLKEEDIEGIKNETLVIKLATKEIEKIEELERKMKG